MDIFKFHNPTSPTKMEQGEIINNIDSKMWVERYREAGEFSLRASVSSGLRKALPIGSFISHVDTAEIMIVENHEITEERGKNAEIVVSGRGFETFLENRVVGSNQTFPVSPVSDYSFGVNYSAQYAKILIEENISATYLLDDDNELPWVLVVADVITGDVSEQRVIPRGNVYERLLEMLEIVDLGVKIIRPGMGADATSTTINIHQGVDRSATVIFSYDTGEIDQADYLWSNKKLKNAALLSGKWVENVILTADAKYNRRMMLVDTSDLDGSLTEIPTGDVLDYILAAMYQRGLQALAAQRDLALTKAEVSRENTRSVYRRDFNVGDLVTVSGDYNETAKMRVSEYVEIEDETGQSAYPTLSLI